MPGQFCTWKQNFGIVRVMLIHPSSASPMLLPLSDMSFTCSPHPTLHTRSPHLANSYSSFEPPLQCHYGKPSLYIYLDKACQPLAPFCPSHHSNPSRSVFSTLLEALQGQFCLAFFTLTAVLSIKPSVL